MLNKNGIRALLVAVLAGLVASASLVSATTTQADAGLPVTVDLNAASTDCANSPGPTVTVSGVVALGELEVKLVFSNNAKGTHTNTQTTTVSASLALDDDSITIPKQPVQGGAGGNPFIWIQFTDADGNPVSDEIFLGRCVQGLDADVSESFTLPSAVTLNTEGDNCDNSPGPYITLSGEISLGGLNAQIIFRNNDNPVGGPHKAVVETTASVEIVPDGTTIVIPKQPVQGGVGGNPWVTLVVGDEEFLLGRCNQDL